MDLLLIVALVVAAYMAWNIGANDLANAMGTITGSGALPIRKVIFLAVTLNVCGAVFFGSRVVGTIAKGIVPSVSTLGALSALLGASIFITIATYLRMPISTSHAIVGAMLGYGIIAGLEVNWWVIVKIILAWVISPLLGIMIGYLVYMSIRKFVLDRTSDIKKAENSYRLLQIISSSYESFAHGSNDVANAVAPLAIILAGGFMPGVSLEIPTWILLFGGVGIGIGIAMWGHRVMKTIGKDITEITYTRGYAAEFSAATTVLMCSYLGLPVSTTHTSVGTVTGVGFARGLHAVSLRIVRNILISWIVTVPIAAAISASVFLILT